MFAVLLAVVFLIIMAVWTLVQVRQDYLGLEQLRPETVASVLGVYTLHFAVELITAWARLWPYSSYSTPSIVLGVILAVIGLLFLSLGTLHMGDFHHMTGLESGELVTTGIFRWSRHPQNLGWALILVGISLVSRSLLALILAFVFWLLFIAYVPMEEAYLESIYGQDYRKYKKNTWQYFGPPGKNKVLDWFDR